MPTVPIVNPIPLGIVNAFLIQGEQAILVDTGRPGSADRILHALKEQGLAPHDLSLILLTHGHSDHVGSSDQLREQTGASVAIHAHDANILRTGQNPTLHSTNTMGKLIGRMTSKTIRGFKPFEPDILIEGELSLEEYGIHGKILMTPGHTTGSVSVLLDSGEILVGDALMGGMMSKGTPRFPTFAENVSSTRQSIDTILKLAPKTIYTGHGGPFTFQEVKAAF